jgi:hypothetical protein
LPTASPPPVFAGLAWPVLDSGRSAFTAFFSNVAGESNMFSRRRTLTGICPFSRIVGFEKAANFHL